MLCQDRNPRVDESNHLNRLLLLVQRLKLHQEDYDKDHLNDIAAAINQLETTILYWQSKLRSK